MTKIDALLGISYECPLKADSLIPTALVPLLIEESDNVTLLCYSKEPSSKFNEEILNYKKRYNIKLILRNKSNSPIIDIVRLLMDVYSIRKASKINTYHCRSYLPSMVGLLFKLLYRDKFIFDPRGVLAEELSYDSKSFSKLYIYIINWIERYFLLFSNKNIFVSTKMRNFYAFKHNIEFTKEDVIRYIYADRRRFTLPFEKPNTDCLQLCYVGSTTKYQMIPQIISFLSSMSSEINLSMTFFVPAISNSYVEKLCKGKGFEYCIKNISNEEIGRLLPKFHYGFLLREDHILNKVASPVKFYEYVSSGLRIISTKYVGDYSELIKENNLGVVVNFEQCDAATLVQDLRGYTYDRKVFESFLERKSP